MKHNVGRVEVRDPTYQELPDDVGSSKLASAFAMPPARLWVERIVLTNFRSYVSAAIKVSAAPVVLIGANGAGKTNVLEAVSLLAPGNGLRRAGYGELARLGGPGDWTVAASVNARGVPLDIGTGQRPQQANVDTARAGRIVRIDGEPAGVAALADFIDMVWLTPAMDGLFTGPASDRRAFLDRLVLCFDHGHAPTSARFERAMRQRNKLLEDGGNRVQLDSLEMQLAECGVAIAAARLEAVSALAAIAEQRRVREAASPFPWFTLALEGTLEAELASAPAIDVEDAYRIRLARDRDRDRGAGRTLEGPHRSDLVVGHGPKSMPARLSSTGEQKALLMGLVLAHAGLIAERRDGAPPILLLDEIAAHFDSARRAALFDEILTLGAQAWMTGTDPEAFSALTGRATFVRVEDGLKTLSVGD